MSTRALVIVLLMFAIPGGSRLAITPDYAGPELVMPFDGGGEDLGPAPLDSLSFLSSLPETGCCPPPVSGAPLLEEEEIEEVEPEAVEPDGGGWRSGIATWYGNEFHGRKMANTKVFNQWGLSTASNSWPLGTMLEVRSGDRVLILEVTDRGAFRHLLDLSRGAFRHFATEGTGVIQVEARPVGP